MYRDLWALTWRELVRWGRSKATIFTSLLTPILYLAIFGQALNLTKLIPPGPQATALAQTAFLGAPDFFSYFSVGMAGFVAVFGSLFVGATVIFDKRLGIVKKALAAPIPRWSIFGSRLIAGAMRPLLLSVVVLGIALAFAHVSGLSGLTVTAGVTALGVGEIALALLCLSVVFTALFLAIGFVMNSPEGYFGLINLVNLPILFSSNALYSTATMPSWLQRISSFNPVSIGIDVLRENLFGSAAYYPYPPEIYLGALVLFTAVVSVLSFLLASRGLRAR